MLRSYSEQTSVLIISCDVAMFGPKHCPILCQLFGAMVVPPRDTNCHDQQGEYDEE